MSAGTTQTRGTGVRVQGTCARLRAGGRVGARGGACTCERQRQTCVCIWALGSRGALGPRTWSRLLRFPARPCTQGVRRRASALGDNQGRSESEGALRHSVCSPSPVSGHPVRQSPMAPDSRTIICGRAPHEPGSVYNRPETPSMPGLLRLFRAACDSTSSIDVTRSMRVSMYGTTCAWCANRTLAPGYLDCAWIREPEHALFGPELSTRKSSASLE